MQIKRIGLTLALGITLQISACSNVFKPFSDQRTNEAYYEDAQKAIDALDYDTAITKFGLMSAAFLAKTPVKRNYAGALAGKCGLNFVEYTDTLSSASIGGSISFFAWLRNAFSQKIISPTYCTLAENQIKSIPAEDLISSDSFNMAILSMVKMGTYLRNKSDVDGSNGQGDFSTDLEFDPCLSTAAGAHNLDDTEMKEIVTGFSLMLLNLTAISSLSGGISNTLTAINVLCQALDPNPCSKTDPANVTAEDVNFFRDLLATDPTHPSMPMGIGTCLSDPNWRACCAPDP